MEKELLLIGTVHSDPDGASRLLELLRKERPVEVLVEVSPYGLSFRRRRGRHLLRILGRRLRHLTRGRSDSWKGCGQILSIFQQIQTPFEYRASIRYSRESGAAIACVDLSSLSREWIQGSWQGMLETRNLKALLGEPPEGLRETAAKGYSLASRLLSEKEKGWFSPYVSWLEDPDSEAREAHLAERVAGTYERAADGRIAYVGGWQHLLHPTHAGTLCDRLAHLHPRRILLRP